MTRFVYDRFSKQYLQELLSPLGEVETSRDIAAEVRQIDVLFLPKTPNPTVVRSLGLLGQIATTPALIEPFRNPVTVDEISSCIGKLLDFQSECNRAAQREERSLNEVERPQLWILSPTVSVTILEGFGAKLERAGIYRLPPSLQTNIVVIHQLPRTPETLWLRLLGKGSVQKGAIAEFNALPDNTLFKDSVLELLSNLFAILDARQDLDSEDRELIMELSPLYLERIQDATTRGVEKTVIRQLRRRFGSLSANLEERVRFLPSDRLENLAEALLDFQNEADLIAWLEGTNN